MFTGTHADLLIIVFHKLITTGSTKLQSLFECLLTIIVNVSPYLKTLTMVSANKLLHFFEAFSTPWFLYCNETNHHLVFYLLEIFNNIIQYQFDGNSNLIYTLLRKRHCFHSLANLPTDYYFIRESLNKEKKLIKSQSMVDCEQMEYAMGNCKIDGDNDKRLLKRSSSIRSKSKTKANKSLPGTPEVSQTLVGSLKEEDAANSESERPIEKVAEAGSTSDIAAAAAGVEVTKDKNDTEQSNSSEPKEQSKEQTTGAADKVPAKKLKESRQNEAVDSSVKSGWKPTSEWVSSWKKKLPLQTIMRMLQVLVPQVEKISLDKGKSPLCQALLS